MDWNCLQRINGFSQAASHLLVHAADDAYKGESSQIDLENKWECPVRLMEAENTQATAFFGPKSVIIAFRGTEPENIWDWITNLSVAKQEIEDGLFIHEGFNEAYDVIHEQAMCVFEEAKDREVFVAGHSLGGALTNPCSWKAEDENFRVKRIYTCGEPRTHGWRAAQEFKNRFDGRKIRVVNRNDIVPRVPSMVRFQHTGAVAYINRRNEIQLNPGATRITYDRILGYRANMIRSHFREHYLKGTNDENNPCDYCRNANHSTGKRC